MKNQNNNDIFLIMGPAFLAVGIIFLTTVNQPLGLAFLAIGTTYIIFGIMHHKNKAKAKKKTKKKKK